MKFLPRSASLFDEMFDDVFRLKPVSSMMKTDIKEIGENYQLEIELPVFKKDDIKIEFDQGSLIISANRKSLDEEKDNDGHIIRQERFRGHCSRSYYVGEDITEGDIKAKFENGELFITIPNHATKQIETKKNINIE